VAGCDAVIHLALSAGWDQMRTREQLALLLETSGRGSRNVLDAAKDAGGLRVVFVSSVAAINCSRTPDRTFAEDAAAEPLAGTLGYSAVKRAAEALVATYVQACLVVRSLCPSESVPARKVCPWLSSAPRRCTAPVIRSW